VELEEVITRYLLFTKPEAAPREKAWITPRLKSE
jgi:hypothetical protein